MMELVFIGGMLFGGGMVLVMLSVHNVRWLEKRKRE
jgi:hypothetical protein